jgi:broad specificity phosphatase PhoE
MRLEPVSHDPFARDLYVIRHGATALNKESGSPDRIRGWKNVPLSAEGRQEAKELAAELANSGIDVLYYSTLSRAADTAEDIAQTTGARLVPVAELKPWNLGHFTGQESSKVHGEIKRYICKDHDKPVPGGESFNTFKTRVFGALAHILAHDDRLPGIVTHHRVERLLAAWDKAGQKPNLSIDTDEMLKHGDSTASARLMKIGSALTTRLQPVEHNPFEQEGQMQ